MSFTDEDYLPAPADLDVPQEIEITSAPLRAAAHQMGKYCDEQCKEFMLCRYEEQDARYCLKEGKAVTACGVEFLTKIKKTCYDSFTNYWQCLDYKGEGYFRTVHCRAEQAVYDNCVLEHLGQERVHYGYFGKVRVHETKRPKPTEIPIKHAPLPDEVPKTFDPEDIKAVKGYMEGELWSKKVGPMLEEATKDIPKTKRPMWDRNWPADKWKLKSSDQALPWFFNEEWDQDAKPTRIWTSDLGDE